MFVGGFKNEGYPRKGFAERTALLKKEQLMGNTKTDS